MKIIKTTLASLLILMIMLGLSTCSEPEKPKPEVTHVNPLQGTIGMPVSIVGKNFSSAQSVNFGSVVSSIVSKSDIEILTVVPPGLSPSDLMITVKTEGGTSNGISFKVLPSEPEITSIEPDRGSVGMDITLKGKYLSTSSSINFGAQSVTAFISKTDNEVKVKIPEGLELGALNVTITSDGGTSESGTFTLVGKPTVSSLTPAIGPAGKKVSIGGTNFEEASKVLFGTGEAIFEIKNSTLIEAIVPAAAATGKIKVVTPGGEALSAVDFVVKDAPEITSFTPASAVVGTLITITGNSFDAGGAVVKFGTGKAIEVNVVSATQLTAKVPATGVTGKITIETAAGSVVSANTFTVIGAPAVTTFSPSSGGVGVDVIITGSNFVNVSGVKFNGTAVLTANYTVVSATQINAKVPAAAATGKISVVSPAGTGTSTANFTIQVPPIITNLTPGGGAVGSGAIINGNNFTDITAITFNTIAVTNFTVNSVTQITVQVPTGATTGKVKVTNPLGTATSSTDFYITPFITSISPVTGGTGTTVTITGTNLKDCKVKFNATEVFPTSTDLTTVVVNVPAGLSGAINISVVNLGGTSNTKTFTITAPVVVDEIIATANIVDQLILLKGSNLLGASKVLFGTVEASIVTNTSKVVTAFIPSSLAIGTYTVKVVTSKGTSNGKTLEVLNVQNPNTGGVSMVNGASVVSLPAGYLPPVSNRWENTFANNEQFQLNDDGNQTLSVELFIDGNSVDTGTGSFDHTIVDGVRNNYVEFTVNGVRYVGMWTPPNDSDPVQGDCLHHITVISTESGKQLEIAVRNSNSFCP